MKELKLVVAESDSVSLVLSDAESEFYLPVTQELRDVLAGVIVHESDAEVDTPPQPEAEETAETPVEQPAAKAPGRPRRTHLSIRPRTIQDRVRGGASIAELAEEADTDESTIEPYAWPILQERSLVAENAHSAHPIVEAEGGPSKQTLWEVLATAFAARGEALADAEWDAYQDSSRRWIVTVSWNKTAAGQTSSHVAEFAYDRRQPEPQIAEPLNSLAADLVDPRYGRPVRSISSVTPLISDTSAGTQDDDPTQELPQPVPQPRQPEPQDGNQEEEFLQHPPAEESPRGKRRRKAVTPHWEDVLLGVRTNPKKNR